MERENCASCGESYGIGAAVCPFCKAKVGGMPPGAEQVTASEKTSLNQSKPMAKPSSRLLFGLIVFWFSSVLIGGAIVAVAAIVNPKPNDSVDGHVEGIDVQIDLIADDENIQRVVSRDLEMGGAFDARLKQTGRIDEGLVGRLDEDLQIMQRVRPDSTGGFHFSHIPAGKYWIYAVGDTPENKLCIWLSPIDAPNIGVDLRRDNALYIAGRRNSQ